MIEKPLMLLVNPAAGRSASETDLGAVVRSFCEAGYAPTVYFTDAPGAAVEMTARLAPNYRRLVCLGGDGTLSDTISGLMLLPHALRPALGYIPMGTANDVATTLGLPIRQPARAAEKLLGGSPLPYDVGEMVDVGYFSYIAAFGVFTEVSYKTDQELKRTLGHLAYVIEGINSLGNVKTYKACVEYEGGSLEGEFLYGAVTNALSVGGVMRLDRQMVDLSDGRFELLLVQKPLNPVDLSSAVTALMNQDYSSSRVLTVVQSSYARFTFQTDVPWTRDGEDGGLHRSLEFRCHPQAINIYR